MKLSLNRWKNNLRHEQWNPYQYFFLRPSLTHVHSSTRKWQIYQYKLEISAKNKPKKKKNSEYELWQYVSDMQSCNCRSIIILIFKVCHKTQTHLLISTQPHFPRNNKWRLSCWKPPPTPPPSAALVSIFQSPLALISPIKHLPAFNFPVQDFSRMAFSQSKLVKLLQMGMNFGYPFFFNRICMLICQICNAREFRL